MTEMFCFQCEQTAGCAGCTGRMGVCGKTADVANAQDALTGALIALAQAQQASGQPAADEVRALMGEALFATLTNVNFSEGQIRALTDRAHEAARELDGEAPDYEMANIWNADEDTRSLKSLVLFGVRGMAAYAYHARVLGYTDETVDAFMFEALAALADDSVELLPLVLRVGEVNLTCMALLDRANTETFGDPAPATVPFRVEPGPFIVVSGHDLHDLKLLLEATDGTDVAVYTHGEMLPAHAYPELAKHPQLKGHLGTAWQNQRTEFAELPAPVLFTTNCLMPPADSYADRVFTCGAVGIDGAVAIGADRDFGPLIERARELGGYAEAREFPGANDGTQATTGFGRATVLSVAGQVVEAVKAGQIGHFFLVAGCDGARAGRSYYTDFVKATPDNSVILTLACGKFRFNDLDLGEVAGLPRLLDMGQCNDAYGAIQVAVALAQAFECGVNDLPLSMVLSWYEQKAVCILLTLLHLGIKGIFLGPTLPAFVSPGVLNVLAEAYNLRPTTTPEADLAACLEG